MLCDAPGTFQSGQFDEKCTAGHFAAGLFDHPATGLDRPTRGQQIVDNQHIGAGGDRGGSGTVGRDEG